MATTGIHHVSIFAGDPVRNVDFYTRVLGLRLVKRTVNFEDAGVYHLYYGDEEGRPGTLLTFFPYPSIAAGRLGVGEASETMLRVPAASIGFWMHRFIEKGVVHEGPVKRFGETVLPFRDPDGTRLALVGLPDLAGSGEPDGAPVPPDHRIAGIHGVGLLVEEAGPTAAILTEVLGYAPIANEDTTTRFAVSQAPSSSVIDLRGVGGFLKSRSGGGTVHHIAFRARNEEEQARMAEAMVRDHGLEPTEVKDRKYFRSIYTREPGHILFEIATDGPGVVVDEPLETLGERLQLPPFFEARRSWIEKTLPPLE